MRRRTTCSAQATPRLAADAAHALSFVFIGARPTKNAARCGAAFTARTACWPAAQGLSSVEDGSISGQPLVDLESINGEIAVPPTFKIDVLIIGIRQRRKCDALKATMHIRDD